MSDFEARSNRQCAATYAMYGGAPLSCVKPAGHKGRHTTDPEDRDNYGVKWGLQRSLRCKERQIRDLTDRLRAAEADAERIRAILAEHEECQCPDDSTLWFDIEETVNPPARKEAGE